MSKYINFTKSICFVAIAALLFLSCKKESFIDSSDAKLSISVDSLFFDTVFTTVGSVTKSFKIFNNNDQKLRITQVKLGGGNSSVFKMNVDGTAGSEINNLEINSNDSLYVFVQVNVNPSAQTNPFLLLDSIQVTFNGNKRQVKLQAYGQNAIFLKNKKIIGTENWNNNLPYVILGGLQVDTNAVLNIAAGTKIYVHADAPFLVDGTLNANGTKDLPIIFTGDRTDEDYKNLPASWPGIYFRNTSKDNFLKHTVIKNAYQGIIAQQISTTANPKVTLSQCIITNIYDAGILGINTNVNVDNTLISNCGSNVVLALGGNYRFVNCTVASYGNSFFDHKNPVLQVTDFITQDGTTLTGSLNAVFQNSIFWGEGGSVDNEIVVSKKGTGLFSVQFDHVLYKVKVDPSPANFVASIKNVSPLFDSINVSKGIFDFHFNKNPSAPAIDAGTPTSFLYDLDDKLRGVKPDIGCYEK
ncbi:MAG: hypothetical protein ABI208_06920 [Ginsengibacter sp.]